MAGVSHGKGGSMHMFDLDKGFYGGHGIVAAQVSIGTGLALGNQYRANGNVCFTYMGDGAINQGQVAESFNMAALHGLPVVYLIENNNYAMGTSVTRSTAAVELHRRGESLGIPGEKVDGMDVLKVHEAGARARAHAAAGNGPTILEMETYRYRGHSMSDPAKYRSREEVDSVKKTRDPIDLLRARILEAGFSDEAQLKKIDSEVKEIIAEAVEFAKAAEEPDAAELFTNVLLNTDL